MAPLTSHAWKSGYAYHPFSVNPTTTSFAYSRRNSKSAIKSCNISAAWTANGLQETLINGVLQGRKQTDLKGASALSKSKMWELFQDINGITRGNVPIGFPYDGVKRLDVLAVRRQVKEETKRAALKGWDG